MASWVDLVVEILAGKSVLKEPGGFLGIFFLLFFIAPNYQWR